MFLRQAAKICAENQLELHLVTKTAQKCLKTGFLVCCNLQLACCTSWADRQNSTGRMMHVAYQRH